MAYLEHGMSKALPDDKFQFYLRGRDVDGCIPGDAWDRALKVS
jgi:hypothetical protein